MNLRLFKPFVTEDVTGEPVEITSKKQLAELCEKYNSYSWYCEDGYNRKF
jgi:hypothetical protein